MRISFEATFDTDAELRDTLAKLADTLPAVLFTDALIARDFRLTVRHETEPHPDDNVSFYDTTEKYIPAHTELPAAGIVSDATSRGLATAADTTPVTEKPKRKRRTKAEMQAAAAGVPAVVEDDEPEDEAAPMADVPAELADGDEPVANDLPEDEEEDEWEDEDEDKETPVEDDEPEVEATPDTLSPADAKLRALVVLREVYAKPAGPASLKALMADYGIAKFSDMADSEGPRMLDAANRLNGLNA